MQANPDKFQAIAVGNKTHAKTPVFKIEWYYFYCKNATPKDKN
jgi:hypothetical protein